MNKNIMKISLILAMAGAPAMVAMNNELSTKELDQKALVRMKVMMGHLFPKEQISEEIISKEECVQNQKVSPQEIEKDLNELVSYWSWRNRFKHWHEKKLANIVENMTFDAIKTIKTSVWINLYEQYRDMKGVDAVHKLMSGIAEHITLNDITKDTIHTLYPPLIIAFIEANKDKAADIAACITDKNINLCDDRIVELLHKYDKNFEKKFVSFIKAHGVCGVAHCVVTTVHAQSKEDAEWIEEAIKKSIEQCEGHDLVQYFLLHPVYGTHWVRNFEFLAQRYKKQGLKIDPLLESMYVDKQSSSHFEKTVKDVSQELAYRLLHSSELRTQLLQVLKVAAREEQKGRYVFFHAQKASWALCQDIFKELWNMRFADKPVGDDYWFLRFTLPGTNMSFWQGKAVMNIGPKDQGFYYETLFTNYALFGSTTTRGSSSVKYLQDNWDYSSIKFNTYQLFEVFDWQKLYKKYASEIEKLELLFKKLVEKNSFGTMLVVSLTEEQVKNSMCSAKSFGFRGPVVIDGVEVYDVVEIIKALKNHPDKIKDIDKTEFFGALADGETGLLNPYNQGIRTYAVRAGDFSEYHKARAELCQKIKTDLANDTSLQPVKKSKISDEISSILQAQADGYSKDKKGKSISYAQDCQKFSRYNSEIKKHDTNKTLRVMTYNVHFWKDGFNLSNVYDVFEVIKKNNPDVVCLQEVSWGETRWNKYSKSDLIKKFRKMGYAYGGHETYGNGKYCFGAPFGNVIFSKYPLSDIKTVQYQMPRKNRHNEYRCFIGATVTFKGKKVRIYNTHLDVWDESGKTRESEIKEWLNHTKQYDKNCDDVMILGDFNETRKRDYQFTIDGTSAWDLILKDPYWDQKGNYTPTTYVEDLFDNAGYKDAYEILGERPPFTVWAGKVIDFCFIRPKGKLKVKMAQPYFTAISDHVPVIFDFEL